jgi:hypothetical protein
LKTKLVLINGTLVIISVLLALLTLEGIARLLPRPYYDWDFRHMFYSLNPVARHADHWTYTPRQTVRIITAYQFPCQPPRIEYDTRYHINNRGLVQERDVDPRRDTVVVLGDSFTEGQGAPPWFYDFETAADAILPPQWQVINYGFQGWGMLHWRNVVINHGDELRIKKAVFMVISDDWMRGYHQWNDADMACFADPARCTKDNPWHSVPLNAGQELILERTRALSAERHGTSLNACLSGFLQQHSRAYRLYKHYTKMARNDVKAFLAARQSTYAKTTQLAAEVLERLGPSQVAFVLIAMRDEADQNQYNAATQALFKELEGIKAEHVQRCMLDSDDFHKIDGHPNAGGYAKIRACAAAALQVLFAKQATQ